MSPGKHLLRRALHIYLSVGQHNDAVHISGDLLHAVAHQHHRRALGAVIGLYLCQYSVPPLGIQPRRRLVQHQHLRFHGDDARDSHTALLSTGELKGRLVQQRLVQSHKGRRVPHPPVDLLRVQSHVLRSEGDVLIHRLLEQLVFRVLEHQPHLEAYVPYFLRIRPDILPLQENTPGRGLQKPVQMLYQRGFTGPGVSDHAQKLPCAHSHAQPLHGAALERCPR